MRALLGVLGAMSAADALWAGIGSRHWSRFWQRVLKRMERQPELTRGVAAMELGIGLLLLSTSVRKRSP